MSLVDDFAGDESAFYSLNEYAQEAIFKTSKGDLIPCNVVVNDNAIGVIGNEYNETSDFEATIDIPRSAVNLIGAIVRDNRIELTKSGQVWKVVSVTSSDELGTNVFCMRKNIYKVKA